MAVTGFEPVSFSFQRCTPNVLPTRLYSRQLECFQLRFALRTLWYSIPFLSAVYYVKTPFFTLRCTSLPTWIIHPGQATTRTHTSNVGLHKVNRHTASCVIRLLQPPCKQPRNKRNSKQKITLKYTYGCNRIRTCLFQLPALHAEYLNN